MYALSQSCVLSLVQTFLLRCEHLVPDSVVFGVLAQVNRLW